MSSGIFDVLEGLKEARIKSETAMKIARGIDKFLYEDVANKADIRELEMKFHREIVIQTRWIIGALLLGLPAAFAAVKLLNIIN